MKLSDILNQEEFFTIIYERLKYSEQTFAFKEKIIKCYIESANFEILILNDIFHINNETFKIYGDINDKQINIHICEIIWKKFNKNIFN